MECGKKASARAYWGKDANIQDLQDTRRSMESYQEAAPGDKVGMPVEQEREWLGEYIIITHHKTNIFTVFMKGTCKYMLVNTVNIHKKNIKFTIYNTFPHLVSAM